MCAASTAPKWLTAIAQKCSIFARNVQARIMRLKERGVGFVEEMPDERGVVSNAITASPDGRQFFLFRYGGEFRRCRLPSMR